MSFNLTDKLHVQISDSEEEKLRLLRNRVESNMSDEEMKTSSGIKKIVEAAYKKIPLWELHCAGVGHADLVKFYWRSVGTAVYVGSCPFSRA